MPELKVKKESKDEKKAKDTTKSRKLVIVPTGSISLKGKKDREGTQYTSIDIGIVNFSICIQLRRKNKPPKNLFWAKWCLVSGKSKRVTLATTQKLTDNLNSIFDMISKSHYVLVETQLRKNKSSIRIEQHTLSYMQLKLPENVKLREVPSKWKFTQLDAPGKMTPYRRKKWAIVKARELLEERKQKKALKFFESNKKKDDLADSYIQIDGFIAKNNLE